MRTCRLCGCDELHACVYDEPGAYFTCFWVEVDLCNFCALGTTADNRTRTPVRGVDLVLTNGGLL